MRIIAGEAKGRTLFAPAGDQTRPTSDKLRGSLFNIMGPRVYDAVVLDVFGGTGALALEAMSRGARYAVICDKAAPAMAAIRRNAENVLKDTLAQRAKLIKADYRSAIGQVRGMRFDIVFLDPPYRMTDAYGDCIDLLAKADALAEDVLIVSERRSDSDVAIPDRFEVYDTRVYGETAVDFIRRRMQE